MAGKWCHIAATSIFYTLDLNPSVNSLDPKIMSRQIRLLDFGVFLVRDYAKLPNDGEEIPKFQERGWRFNSRL
jgi:hypothetical protein